MRAVHRAVPAGPARPVRLSSPLAFRTGHHDRVRDQVTLFLNTIFNEEVANNLLGNTVDTILNNGQTDVVSVGLIISLWAGSSAMSAFVESITIAYCQHEFRHPVVERFFALGPVHPGTAGRNRPGAAARHRPRLPAATVPGAWRPGVRRSSAGSYYPGIAIGLILMLTTLYKVARSTSIAWYRGLPGRRPGGAVFLVASTGLRLYLSYVYSHGLTYGALATPITFLLFYYFISMAIIIGAQFNNALLEYYPPVAGSSGNRSTARSATLTRDGP